MKSDTPSMGMRKRRVVMIFVNALAAFGATTFAEGAWANGSTTGIITSVYVNRQLGNVAFIGMSTAKSNSPSCQTNLNFQYVLDMSTADPNAAQLFTMILAARTAQLSITLTGEGTCSVFAGTEDLIVVEY